MVWSPGSKRKGSVRPPAPADDSKTFAAMVGEALRRARQTRGWTQAQLADAAGLSTNYVARLERGELGPSLFVASRLAASLDIDVETLMSPPSRVPARTTKRRIVG
jgi:transcriptional regulator with XRE-family HTH domain